MKKQIQILIFFVIILSVVYLLLPAKVEEQGMENEEKRAIFISYIELGKYIRGHEEATMKNTIDDMIDTIRDFDFNMILLQVRSFSDAIYPSTIFPSSKTVVETEGDPLPFDILDYFIEQAHAANLELHAWVNPYRIRSSADMTNISTDNPAYAWLHTNKVKEVEGKGLFYNPAEKEVETLILQGIQEILDNYAVDGIHFDDYFYPDDTIDALNYEQALQTDPNLSLQDYRLGITSQLIKKVYQLVKKKDRNLLFGISPEGNITNNYETNYIDTKLFGSQKGYVDYLMPQIYYGFLNGVRPYYNTVQEWNQLITEKSVMFIPALAFYKSGTVDNYAKEGANEWIEYNNIIMREILVARPLSMYAGFAIYRYDSVFGRDISQAAFLEKENLKSILY